MNNFAQDTNCLPSHHPMKIQASPAALKHLSSYAEEFASVVYFTCYD